MTDLTKAIEPKSDQLNADDLLTGPRTITITRVAGQDGEQPISIFFEGDNGKPFKPSKSMLRVLVLCWGPEGDDYAGRRLTLYRDPEVKFGGIKVGGIRISHMSHIDGPREMSLTASRGKKAPYSVQPLVDNGRDQLVADGMAAARKGKDAFNAWWNTPAAKTQREFLTTRIEDFKQVIAEWENAGRPIADRIAGNAVGAASGQSADEAPEGDASAPSDRPQDASDAYLEGQASFSLGTPVDANPYDEKDPSAANEWLRGWRAAEQGG